MNLMSFDFLYLGMI